MSLTKKPTEYIHNETTGKFLKRTYHKRKGLYYPKDTILNYTNESDSSSSDSSESECF